MTDGNGWETWKNAVLGQLRDLKSDIKEQNQKLDNLNHCLIETKVKAGMWGALSGSVASLIAIFTMVLIYLTYLN